MKLIDADALLSDIEHTIEESGCVNHESEIMDCVRYAQEVDAVPVVRCRECKHNRNCFIKEMIIAETKQDNPYCSCGARMDGES